MTTRRWPLLLLAGLALAIAPAAPAQFFCNFGDDGFDLGCCGPTLPHLPPFPQANLLAEWGVIYGCGQLFAIPPVNVQLSAPAFVLCDYALITVNAQFPGGETIQGTLLAKYARTWVDFNPLWQGQVWRFLINGDLVCQPSPGSNVCTTVLPRCAAINTPQPAIVHFDGHIDYACNPLIAGGFDVAFSLNHMQGCISHAPWSQAPLTGPVDHQEVSYHLVGPAPFIFGGGGWPQGVLNTDAVRSSHLRLVPNFQYQCFSESDLVNFSGSAALSNQQNGGCLCAFVDQCTNNLLFCPTPACYEHQSLNGWAACPVGNFQQFQSVPINGTPIAPSGLVCQAIGSWSVFNYPWNASLSIDFGVLSYQDVCGHANWNIHAVVGVGVTNVFGQTFNTTQQGGPPPQFVGAFVDLQNVLLLSSPFLVPGYGSVSAADVVWNLSM